MQVQFKDEQLTDWYTGDHEGKQPFTEVVLKAYRKTVDKLVAAPTLTVLKQNKSLDLHPLKRDLAGRFAVRVNMQYRIIFALIKDTDLLEVIDIKNLTDYH